MSRWTRASFASSLLALLSAATGCGESNTHSAREVRAILARHGLASEAAPTEPPKSVRTKLSAAELRIGIQLRYAAARLDGLANRKVARRNVFGDGFTLLVAHDVPDAVFVAQVFRQPVVGPRVRPRLVDNVVVLQSTPRVDAALADLR